MSFSNTERAEDLDIHIDHTALSIVAHPMFNDYAYVSL